ncbi:hypothetical protein Gotur_010267 [Gossypium turneri]
MISEGQFAIDMFPHIKCVEVTEYLNEVAVFRSIFFSKDFPVWKSFRCFLAIFKSFLLTKVMLVRRETW